MSTSSNKGPLIVIVIGAIVLVVIFVIRPMLFDKKQRSTSDAATSSEVVTIAGDGYLGYWFITSPEMRMLAPRNGIEINFVDDGGAYADRLEKFNEGKYDCIVLPVNSYLQHGAQYKFPGVIVAAISESKGADAILCFGDVLPNGKINELNDPNLRIVYTSESPSSFLIDLIISDFDLDQLRQDNSWRHEVSSSEEVYRLAEKAKRDPAVGDVFVMWEPEVSKAIDRLGMKPIWGSDKFGGYIIDVFVFRRDFVDRKQQIAQKFLKTYFRTLDCYVKDRERMLTEMSKSTGIKHDAVENMVKKIDWFNLQENCSQQFGIQTDINTPTADRIVSAIIACSDVMEKVGSIKQPLRDPYRIINSTILETIAKSSINMVGGQTTTNKVVFSALNANEWKTLNEIGTMRIEPITFQSGTNYLDEAGKEMVDKVAQMLVNNYPTYRVAVRGHTSPGDPEANQKLSLERAQTVVQRLIAVHSIDPNRLRGEGLGATQPPQQKPGESIRSLRFRMPRVEFVLLEGNAI